MVLVFIDELNDVIAERKGVTCIPHIGEIVYFDKEFEESWIVTNVLHFFIENQEYNAMIKMKRK